MRISDPGRLKDVLGDLAFPADKERIVAHARDHGADEVELKALRALPLGEYDALYQVERSVPVDPAPERTGTERAEQRRDHRHADLAEYERPAHRSPIEEELDNG
ncbi:DUF2795 domain-containing protein [Actinomadura flavalba]|uniref:DUF2795 domain-containing protein n=1 Tax=Actinomadura flavalba TaxID=1120938 RepID=UPI0003783DD2|nr:DUF2795 domain-containing protein [Actinomadura flavalba]